MITIDSIINKVKVYNPKADLGEIKKAYQFAQKAHQGQIRLSGKSVIGHCLAVASALADWKLDTSSIIAGLLHDTVEDTETSLEQLRKKFGEEVAGLVNGVTKVGEIKLRGPKEEEFVENLRKMLIVMAKDLRVVLIKLADRYHNMQTLQFLPKEKQLRIARETLEVYAPLAERLGIGEMKSNLEDLAFPYVYPKEYKWLKELTEPYYYETEVYVQKAVSEINKKLKVEKIKAEVHGRAKHFYSLWKKLLRPEVNREIEKVYDLIAIRIITDSICDCYGALGIIHSFWKPVPYEGVRDFIAQPKPNGYRSIHTTVFGPEGKIFEVQIRTQEMHEQAENGIAAHWYMAMLKAKGKLSSKDIDKGEFFAPSEKLAWVKQLVTWQREIVDSKEFLKALKLDALAHRIFVFSPKGDVFDLPSGATPVDFAYTVHTDLGDRTNGAKINGKLVKLDYQLKSGDIVEIVKGKQVKPSHDWLNFVVTTTAKRKIAKWVYMA